MNEEAAERMKGKKTDSGEKKLVLDNCTSTFLRTSNHYGNIQIVIYIWFNNILPVSQKNFNVATTFK